MAISHVDVDDYWQPVWTFKVGAVDTDPTTLVLTHRFENQDGVLSATTTITEAAPASLTPTSQPISRTAAGVYRLNLLIASPGHYWAKAKGTGAVVAAEQHEAIADTDAFAASFGLSSRALVGLGETKDWLNQNKIDTGEDRELVRLINDVSDRFHEEAQREFKVKGTNPQTRTFEITIRPSSPWYIDGEYQGDLDPRTRVLRVGDLTSFTVVDIVDYDWTTVLTPTVPLADIRSYPLFRGPTEPIRELVFHTDVTNLAVGRAVTVTGNFGFPAVPGDVRQAVLDSVAAIRDRDVEHYRQDLGAVPSIGGEAGTVVMVAGGGQRLLALPPVAQAVAWRYRDVSIG